MSVDTAVSKSVIGIVAVSSTVFLVTSFCSPLLYGKGSDLSAHIYREQLYIPIYPYIERDEWTIEPHTKSRR